MKDINKILAKAHFKCKKKIDGKKQHIFAETCLYGSVGILPHVLCTFFLVNWIVKKTATGTFNTVAVQLSMI